MIESLLTKIGAVLGGIFITIGSIFTPITVDAPQVDAPEYNVGANAVSPFAGQTYTLSGSGISSSATSITLSSLTNPQSGYKILDSDLSDTFYLTIEPGNRTKQEIVSCTTVVQNANNTATLSGCTRGLSPLYPYTASTTIQFSHGGGSQVVFSNPPQFYNQFAAKANDETITGDWKVPTPVNPTSIVNKGYSDSLANQGAATSTESNGGIVELGTLAEQANSYDGGASKPTILQTKNSTSTCQVVGSYNIVASSTTGKLDKNCFDAAGNFTFTGTNSFSGTQTYTGTNSFSATTTVSTTTQTGVGFGTSIVNEFTAGETINAATTPIPVMYATSSAKVYQVDGNVASTTNFIGYAINNSAVNGTSYVQTSGVVKGFTGLTAGLRYYVQDAVGTIGTTVGTAEIYAGTAISTTAVLIERNDAGSMQYLGSQVLTCTGGSVVDNTINQPWARHAVLEINSSNGNSIDGSVFISKIGKTSGTVAATDSSGGSAVVSVNASWTGGSLRLTANTGDSCSVTAYYYR